MSFHPTEVNLYHASIHTTESGNRIRFGPNAVVGLFNKAKKTQGFGQQLADFVIIDRPENVIDDRDIADSK